MQPLFICYKSDCESKRAKAKRCSGIIKTNMIIIELQNGAKYVFTYVSHKKKPSQNEMKSALRKAGMLTTINEVDGYYTGEDEDECWGGFAEIESLEYSHKLYSEILEEFKNDIKELNTIRNKNKHEKQ